MVGKLVKENMDNNRTSTKVANEEENELFVNLYVRTVCAMEKKKN